MSRGSLLALLFIGFSGIASANDARRVDCESKIPRDLVAHLIASEPTLSLPAKEDLDQANIDFDIASGGDGCYLISKGMFDVGEDEGFALLLVARRRHPQLVVASRKHRGWSVQHLPTFCDDIRSCYVKRGGPGTYVRTEALDNPVSGKAEREKLITEHDVVISGRMESTAVTYADEAGTWFYVWTSD